MIYLVEEIHYLRLLIFPEMNVVPEIFKKLIAEKEKKK